MDSSSAKNFVVHKETPRKSGRLYSLSGSSSDRIITTEIHDTPAS